MIADREGLENVLARHGRVWLIVVPAANSKLNVPDVNSFIRQHMEVVYEDFSAMVLFRDRKHHHAVQRAEEEQRLQKAKGNLLP